MIYSDPSFRKGAATGFLCGPALFAASVIEGEQLVKSDYLFVKMTHGAHSVGVTALLLLGFFEIAQAYNKNCSLKSKCFRFGALVCLLAGTFFHVLSLVNLYQRGAPLDRRDIELRRYLNFCRVYIFANMVIEYLIYNLTPVRPKRTSTFRMIQ